MTSTATRPARWRRRRARRAVALIGCALDVSDTASLAAAADLAVAELGGLEIWVNNAAIFPTTGPAVDADDAFVDRMLHVNVRGTYAGRT